jgi:hypothetical protein
MIGSTFWEENLIDSISGKKHDWQHILGKNMIGSIFWGKPRLSAHSGKKNMIGSTFWEKHD